MKAIILAAGRGSRLGHLTDKKPKCLNILGHKTLLEWQISALKNGGIEEIIIMSGYRSDMLEKFGCRTIINPDWSSSNMVTSLLCASELFGEEIIVSYSDIVYSSDIIERLIAESNDAVISYDRSWLDLWSKRFDDPLSDAESFIIDEQGKILDIGRKVKDVSLIQGQYMGLLKLTPTAFQWINSVVNQTEDQGLTLDMTTLLSRMIDNGNNIFGMPCSGGWCEIDDESDLQVAEKLLSEGKIKYSAVVDKEIE